MPRKKTCTRDPIGDFHIGMTEGRTEEGRLCLFVASDRAWKCADAERHAEANQLAPAQFLRNLVAAIPYTIRTVLTDNGIQFTNHSGDLYAFPPIVDRVRHEHGMDQRLTKPNHPWPHGLVARRNRTLKEATARQYEDESHDRLNEHLPGFLMAYHFAKRLKTVEGLAP